MARTKYLRSILICFLLFLALQLNAHLPVFRLSSGIANNQLVFLLSCGLPWIAFIFGFFLQNARTRRILCVAFVPILLWSVVAGFGALIAGADLETINRTSAGPSANAIYRINRGAKTDFRLLIRQEWRVLPGLELVRDLDLLYPAYSAAPDYRSEYHTERVAPYETQGRTEVRHRIRSHVYF
jgi:hypothetical protein